MCVYARAQVLGLTFTNANHVTETHYEHEAIHLVGVVVLFVVRLRRCACDKIDIQFNILCPFHFLFSTPRRKSLISVKCQGVNVYAL